MFTRIFSAAFAFLYAAACSEASDAPPGSAVECALAGSASFAADCTMERQQRDGLNLLVIRHPDGGLRRFELGVADEGIVTADGAEEAQIERQNGLIEVRVGADRYRLPVAE